MGSYKKLEEIRHQQLYEELFELMIKKAIELLMGKYTLLVAKLAESPRGVISFSQPGQ